MLIFLGYGRILLLFEGMDKKPGVLFFYFQDIDLTFNPLSLVTYPKMIEIPVFRRVCDHQTSGHWRAGALIRPAESNAVPRERAGSKIGMAKAPKRVLI